MAHRWPVSLKHRAVVLRPMKTSDRKEWDAVRTYNRNWLMPWEASLPPGGEPGPPSFGGLVRVLNQQGRQGRSLPWLVAWDERVDRTGTRERLAGQVTVSGITYGSANFGQIGYWIDARLAGRGIIPTAVAMASDYAFFEMGLHRIEIAIRPENGNSLRVVEKLGFRHEGSRPRYLHINGDWRDHEVFALNAEEVPDGVLRRIDPEAATPR